MKTIKGSIAALELVLILPGALFMTALFVRNSQPVHYEPARSAQALVEWFGAHPHPVMDLGLVALPLAAFVLGSVIVLRTWRCEPEFRQAALRTLDAIRANLASLLIAAATVVAGGILGIVALHVITD